MTKVPLLEQLDNLKRKINKIYKKHDDAQILNMGVGVQEAQVKVVQAMKEFEKRKDNVFDSLLKYFKEDENLSEDKRVLLGRAFGMLLNDLDKEYKEVFGEE